jgi:hypothetical protein
VAVEEVVGHGRRVAEPGGLGTGHGAAQRRLLLKLLVKLLAREVGTTGDGKVSDKVTEVY